MVVGAEAGRGKGVDDFWCGPYFDGRKAGTNHRGSAERVGESNQKLFGVALIAKRWFGDDAANAKRAAWLGIEYLDASAADYLTRRRTQPNGRAKIFSDQLPSVNCLSKKQITAKFEIRRGSLCAC